MRRLQLGVIGRPHGVRGLVKITSHTADPTDLTAYGPLFGPDGRRYVVHWKGDGVAEVSVIVDGVAVKVADRSRAEKLTNTKLFIDRSSLPPTDEDEFYLTDLMGLAVHDAAGVEVGLVYTVHDYGAGASLEIQRPAGAPLLIPFTAACVPSVDIANGRLVVVLPDEVVVLKDDEVLVQEHGAIPVPDRVECVVEQHADIGRLERAAPAAADTDPAQTEDQAA